MGLFLPRSHQKCTAIGVCVWGGRLTQSGRTFTCNFSKSPGAEYILLFCPISSPPQERSFNGPRAPQKSYQGSGQHEAQVLQFPALTLGDIQ